MRLVRTVSGLIVASGLIVGVSACGGDDKAPPLAGDTPPANGTPTSVTPSSVTLTPVDPTTAAKAKVLADYEHFISVRGRGWVSNKPSFPYEEVMTGKALSSTKAVVTGADLAGWRYSGSLKFIKASVVTVNLEAKPATAIVRACVHDALVAKTKAGKVISPPPAYASREDQLTLVAGNWKASDTKTTGQDTGKCPS